MVNVHLIPTPTKKTIDDFAKLPAQDMSAVNETLKRYKATLEMTDPIRMQADFSVLALSISLKPQEIDALYQRMCEEQLPMMRTVGSEFVTMLMQTAYNNGHSYFTLNTSQGKGVIEPDLIGAKIKGSKETPIQLHVYGDVGNYFLEEAQHVHAYVYGSIWNNCLERASNVIAVINGDVGTELCIAAENCDVTIEGDTHDSHHNHLSGKGNVFRCKKKETYDFFKTLIKKNPQNEVILLE